ncbi:hypothetical protein [Kocuria sp. SL71]|nr:hypothetical protein [Kocuria sp. SL71]MCY1685152.1 hypothetical protein [Kocuria sp. SL71]
MSQHEDSSWPEEIFESFDPAPVSLEAVHFIHSPELDITIDPEAIQA